MPDVRVPSVAAACKVVGGVPLPGETVNQLASGDAVKVKDPPPVFVTLTEAGAGFEPLP